MNRMNNELELAKLSKLPFVKADEGFKEKLAVRISQMLDENTNKSIWQVFMRNISNIALLCSVVVLVLSVANLMGVVGRFPQQNINVEIALSQKTGSEVISEDNVLLIYDLNNEEAEVRADYTIEQNKLRINLKPGNYRIIFSSTVYEDVVLAAVNTTKI